MTAPYEPCINVSEVSARIERRLAAGVWEERQLTARLAMDAHEPAGPPRVDSDAAAEVAAFAMSLSGARRAARRGGRWSKLVVHFALAATVALTGVAAGCEAPNGSDSAIVVDNLPITPGDQATLLGSGQAEPARYADLVLLDPGADTTGWALLAPAGALAGGASKIVPILVDRNGAGLDTVGATYTVPARAITVGTRDGPAQFLDSVAPAIRAENAAPTEVVSLDQQVRQRWAEDERFAATTRAITATPRILDAAYNAAAAAAAGGVHTYSDGVVLRVDPQDPVLYLTDKSLIDQGKPLRAEDMVYVGIRPEERVIYDPGQVVTLRNVAVNHEKTDVEGTQEDIYVVNAAVDGARVEPTGKIDLQRALQQRLTRTDADLAVQAQELAAESPAATPTAGPSTASSTVGVYRGPSLLDDYLMYLWLRDAMWYRGSSSTIGAPPPSPNRPTGDYYYVPPATTARDAPPPSQTTSRSTALQAARNAVSGQAAGTGGGTAATTKAASLATARVSAATNKAASIAGRVGTTSVGKSAPAMSGSSSASRSSGAIRSSSSSSSSGSRIGGSTSSKGFGGTGISGGGAS